MGPAGTNVVKHSFSLMQADKSKLECLSLTNSFKQVLNLFVRLEPKRVKLYS
jgi:hypothetical protein